MKTIGIIDSEIVWKSLYSEKGKHRFPNLASMKISGYHKSIGNKVTLITELPRTYQLRNLCKIYDKIYISKVFVETSVPTELLKLPNVVYGGTGFFFGSCEPLSPKIENHIPDYHLYDDWIKERKTLKSATDEFSYYEDYSIGYSSRGCVRQCKFCINQYCTESVKASPIKEFLDINRNYICLLDDNVLACKDWREIFDELNATGKTFEFKQGLDIRALTEEKVEVLINSKINTNTLYFAFDNIEDKDIIEEKLKLWRRYYRKNTHMYILCGFDRDNKYDEEFWAKDIQDTLERISICIKYGIFPYVMRFHMWNSAPTQFYRGMYIVLSSWCNQKSLFSKLSLNEWADKIQKANEKQLKKKRLYSSKKYLMEYAGKHPEIAYKYFDLKYNEDNKFAYEKDSKIIVNMKDKYTEQPSVNFSSILKLFNSKDTVTNISENIKNKKEKIFNNGLVLTYRKSILTSIPNNKIKLLLINFKDDSLQELDKLLLKFSQSYLKNEGSLYLFNTNLKSFTFTKDFVEENTNFRFLEVTNFTLNKKNFYCSRYIFKANRGYTKIFKNETFSNKLSLLEYIVENTSKKNNIIVSFFENYIYFEKINDLYKRVCICIKKDRKKSSVSLLKFLKEKLNTSDNTQISLLDSENKDIG